MPKKRKSKRLPAGADCPLPSEAPPPAPLLPPPPAPVDPRLQLEAEKLQEELADIRNARKNRWFRWLWSVKPNEWIVAGAAVVALFTAFYTGIFDATRQNLAAQQERLQTEKLLLEQTKDKLTAEVASLRTDAEEAKKRLAPFESEQAAVEDLRQMKERKIEAAFSVTPGLEGFKVTLRSPITSWGVLPEPPRTNPNLTDSLKAVNKLHSVKGLRVIDLTMTADDLALATQHSEIGTLILGGGIETKALAGLRPLPNLHTLVLWDNKLTSLGGCPAFPSATELNLGANPIDDEALASIPKLFPNRTSLDLRDTDISDEGMRHIEELKDLRDLGLYNTKVSDDGMKHIAKLRNLYSLNLEYTGVSDEGMKYIAGLQSLMNIKLDGSKVTGEGVLTLLSCPKLLAVVIAPAKVSDSVRATLKQRRPTNLDLIHDPSEDVQWRVFEALANQDRW